MTKVVIPGKFDTLNEFVRANRSGYHAGNAMKKRDQQTVCYYLPRKKFKKVFLEYHYFEPNSRRDKDNVCGYFHKIFQDALVQKGLIPNDGWKEIEGMADYFAVDKRNPRIEVYIREVEK